MKTIKVKAKNEKAKIWNPCSAGYLTGNAVAEVPDVPFWRKRIDDGTLVEVKDGPSKAPAPVDETKGGKGDTKDGPSKGKEKAGA